MNVESTSANGPGWRFGIVAGLFLGLVSGNAGAGEVTLVEKGVAKCAVVAPERVMAPDASPIDPNDAHIPKNEFEFQRQQLREGEGEVQLSTIAVHQAPPRRTALLLRVDRKADPLEHVEVAVDRPLGRPQLTGDVRHGHLSPLFEQHEQPQLPCQRVPARHGAKDGPAGGNCPLESVLDR